MPFSPFKQTSQVQYGVIGVGTWPTLSTGLDRNITKIVNYYQYVRKPVRNNHPLIKLIHAANIPKNIPLESYTSNVEDVAVYAARVAGFATSITPGQMFTGVFMSEDQPEFILAYRDFFDPHDAHTNWRDVQAVRLISTPYTCSYLPYPNGKNFSTEKGPSFFSVNVPLLMVQFRAFYLQQVENYKRDPFSVEPITRFVGGYVLPNMMRDFQDMFILNRAMAKYRGGSDGDARVIGRHMVNLTDYSKHIDGAVSRMLENIPRLSSKAFPSILKNLPCVRHANMESLLLMPDIMPTKQSAWVSVVARLKELDFLIELAGSDLKNRNQMAINQFSRYMNTYHIKAGIMENLPLDIAMGYVGLIDKIYAACGIVQEA